MYEYDFYVVGDTIVLNLIKCMQKIGEKRHICFDRE
jgi:hypothetical protein